jgi:hypothetical protein
LILRRSPPLHVLLIVWNVSMWNWSQTNNFSTIGRNIINWAWCTPTHQRAFQWYEEHNKRCHGLGDLIMTNKLHLFHMQFEYDFNVVSLNQEPIWKKKKKALELLQGYTKKINFTTISQGRDTKRNCNV